MTQESMVGVDRHPKIAATLNVIASLEDIISRRANRRKGEKLKELGEYRATTILRDCVVMLKRGVDECEQLIELNPKATKSYTDQLGVIAATALTKCKFPPTEEGVVDVPAGEGGIEP